MQFTETELLSLVASFVWPMLRISAMFVSMPVFSANSISVRVRMVLAVAVTVVVMPVLPQLPDVEMLSYQGVMIAVQQVAIGILAGFVLQVVFAAMIFGGQSIAFSMGLGFSQMVDPQTGVQVPVIAQFYSMTTTLVFLAMDGHLLLIEMLLDSFRTLPIALQGISTKDIWELVGWTSRLFSGGVLLALPVICSILLINIGFGVATRAAPQLNIFSIGFVVTILLGLVMVWLTLPVVLDGFSGLLSEGYRLTSYILRLE